jgi:hypothetical protein
MKNYKVELRNINRYIVFILFVMNVSCFTKDLDLHTTIDLNQSNTLSIHDIFRDIEVVQLETQKECLISTIHKVEYHNGHFYVFDRIRQEIFCFDKLGNFTFKISDRGNGPNEYIYVCDFTIDGYNNRILLLVPQGKLHIYDLTGCFIKVVDIRIDNILSYNEIYSIDKTSLLFISYSKYHLLFFSNEAEKIIKTEFKIPGLLQTFSPLKRVVQYENKTLFIPALSQDVYDISSTVPKLFYKWNFGVLNNSERQINTLINALQANSLSNQSIYINDVVGKKQLNQYIIQLIENERYRIAVTEYNNDYYHVIIDKKHLKTFVIKRFEENIGLFHSDNSSNSIIMYNKGYDYSKTSRDLSFFNLNSLSPTNQNIIKNHNPEVDNPFIIIYMFKMD